MSFALATLFLAPAVPSGEPDVKFSRWEMFDARLETVEIWAKSEWKDGKQLPTTAVMRRTITYRPELNLRGQTTLIVESAQCAAIVPALKALTKLPTPEIDVKGLPGDGRVIVVGADGAQYRLSTDAYFPNVFGKIELNFGAETPVAEWIDQSLRNFAPCWSAATSR